MVAIGLLASLALILLGLADPLLLAVLAGLCEVIPVVGPFLSSLPALLVALTVDPSRALLLVPIAVAIQQIDGNLLIPRIMSQAVRVSPLTVILRSLIGSILYGSAGAFLAVSVPAAVQVIINDTLRPALEAKTSTVPVPLTELEGDHQPSPRALGLKVTSDQAG
jgi:predicted PurR-regulated permease PerM